MTTEGITDDAVPVVELEYQDRSTDPWRPVARLAAAAVVAQGATTAVSLLWRTLLPIVLGGLPSTSWRFLGVPYVLELLMSTVAVALAVAGWSARAWRAGGRTAVLVLEPAYALLLVVQGLFSAVLYLGRAGGGAGRGLFGTLAVQILLGVLPSVVLPALLWLVFRRPEVRATFQGEGPGGGGPA